MAKFDPDGDALQHLTGKKKSKPLTVRSSESSPLIYFKSLPLLLTHFPHDTAERFLEMGANEPYDTHEEILKEGEVGRDMFLICEGSVSIWNKGVRLALLEKGDVFGELILFRDNYRIASVRAEEYTRVLRFDRQALMEFLAEQGQEFFDIYIMNIIEILRRKLIDTNRRVVELERAILEK